MKITIFVWATKRNAQNSLAMMNYVYYDTSLQETMILTEAFHTGRVICENDNLYKFIWVWEGKLTLTETMWK